MMIKHRLSSVIILFFSLAAISLVGCSTASTKEKDKFVGIQDEKTENEFSDFILGVGDSIKITVYGKKASQFIIVKGDSIEISVYRQSDLDRKVQVDSFGKIMFPLIGDIKAAGKTAFELRDEIQYRLSKYIKNPQVSVDVTSTESLILDDLSISAQIGTSGKIMYPLIGDVQAAGKGTFELRNEIQQRLSKYLVDPQVTINVSTIQSQKVHVLGEVKSPGTFILDKKIFALEAISKAGGFSNDANEGKVLLLRDEKGMPKVTILNLEIKKMIKNEKIYKNVPLKNGDIVFVPPSLIANVERFMVRFSNIIEPFTSLERAIIFWPQVIDALEGKRPEQNIIVAP